MYIKNIQTEIFYFSNICYHNYFFKRKIIPDLCFSSQSYYFCHLVLSFINFTKLRQILKMDSVLCRYTWYSVSLPPHYIPVIRLNMKNKIAFPLYFSHHPWLSVGLHVGVSLLKQTSVNNDCAVLYPSLASKFYNLCKGKLGKYKKGRFNVMYC